MHCVKLLFGVSVLAMASQAYAQAASQPVVADNVDTHADPTPTLSPAPAQASGDGPTEIVVTGSRIIRDGSAAPTPVTVLSSQYMGQRGQTNVADALNELPSFRPAQTPAGSSNRSQLAGSNFVDLRGLGSTRTLTLVDGKRFVPSAGTGQVDLNLIPSILIQRTEVVTGGASASYGSDAVAGVVNLILKKDYTGLEGDVQYGRSELDDNIEYRVALHAGASALEGRLHVSAAGEYFRNEGVGDQFTRDWGRAEPGLVTNPAPGTNGLPLRVLTTNVHDSLETAGGLITSGPLRGIQFDPSGRPLPFTFGQLAGSQQMIGGDGASFFYQGFNLLPKLERKIGYGRVALDVNAVLRLFADVSYGEAGAKGQSASPFNYGNLTIQADNAYLPQSIRTALVAQGQTSFGFGKFNSDVGPALTDITTRTSRAVFGLEGKIGSGWTYDAHFEHGRNRYIGLLTNSRQIVPYRQAIDAVVNPTTGAIVCRSTLTDPANGCQPFNPFGVGVNDASASAYFTGTQRYDQITEQNVLAANIQGPAARLPGGPLSVAIGGEYRKERAEATSDAASQANLWDFGNPKPMRGRYDVKEVYGEVSAPLLSDVSFARKLELTGAFRYTDYSISGSVTTWKIGGDWQPADWLRLRATRSRDIRAPNISELFTPSRLNPTTLRDPRTGDSYFVSVFTAGNLALRPEKANTFTGGILLQPVRNLRLSIDYYDIKVNDAISTIQPQNVVDRCESGEAALCELVVRDGTSGRITALNNVNINVADVRTRGFDIELGYSLQLSDFSSLPGELSLRTFATRVVEFNQSDGRIATRLAGQTSLNGVPKWIVNSNLGYDAGALSLLLQTRFISAGKYDLSYVEGVDINDNSTPSRTYFNLSASYKLRDTARGRIAIFGVINNLLDKDPPLVPVYGTGATNFAYYDVIGRSFKAGVRFGF